MKARSLAPAQAEFAEAIEYYHRISPELGIRFERAVHRAVVKVLEAPTTWPKIEGEYRRCTLERRFKYGVVYRVDDEGIVIVAFMHLSRKQGYWLGRD